MLPLRLWLHPYTSRTHPARIQHHYCSSVLGKMNDASGVEVRSGPQDASCWVLNPLLCTMTFVVLLGSKLTPISNPLCTKGLVQHWPAYRTIECVSILRNCCKSTHLTTWSILRRHFISHVRIGDYSRWRTFQFREKHMRQRFALFICQVNSSASRWLLFSW